MKSRGSMSLIVLVICILVVGATVYALWDQHTAMQASNPDARTFSMGAAAAPAASSSSVAQSGPYGAIDLYSLSNNTETPTVTGTCGNAPGSVELAIMSGDIQPPSDILPGSPVYSVRSGDDFDAACAESKGAFSTRDGAIKLEPGEYTAALYMLAGAGTSSSAQLLSSHSFPVDSTSTPSEDFRPLKSGSAVRASDGQSGYARDDDGIYTLSADGKGAAIAGIDPATFAVSAKWPVFARDKNHAYVEGVPIPNADPTTFTALCGIPGNDPCLFSKDQFAVYSFASPILEADAATFVSLESPESSDAKSWLHVAADKNAVYVGYVTKSAEAPLGAGARIASLSDGAAISFSDTAQLHVLDSPGWAGKGTVSGGKLYKDGGYFSDGDAVFTLYRVCDVAGANCEEKIARVAKEGSRPSL